MANQNVTGPGIKAMQEALRDLASRGAPREYNDFGFNKGDWTAYHSLLDSGHIDGISVPAAAAATMLKILSHYRNTQVRNYEEISSLVAKDMKAGAGDKVIVYDRQPLQYQKIKVYIPHGPDRSMIMQINKIVDETLEAEGEQRSRDDYGNMKLPRYKKFSNDTDRTQLHMFRIHVGILPRVLEIFKSKGLKIEHESATVAPTPTPTPARERSPEQGTRPLLKAITFSDEEGPKVRIKVDYRSLDQGKKEFLKESIQYTFPDYEWNRQEFHYTVSGNYKQYVSFGRLLARFGYDASELRTILRKKLDDGRIPKTEWEGKHDDNEEFISKIEERLPDSKFDLYDEQKKGIAFLYGRDHAILGDETGLGKCLLPGSWVQTSEGIFDIEQIWESFAKNPIMNEKGEEWAKPSLDLYVHSMNSEEKIVKAKIVGIYREKIDSYAKEVHTSNGRTIRSTIPHRFYTDSGWKSEISPGDLIGSSPNHNDLYYEKITEVKKIKYEGYVYDLCVETHQNYIANGLICHNTVQLISAAALRMQDSKRPTLIITLKSTQRQWAEEVVNVMGDQERGNISTDPLAPRKWTVLYYENFSSGKRLEDAISTLSKAGFGVVIFDELHKVKHSTSKRSQNISKVVAGIPTKWGASATVSSNRPMDVRNQLSMTGHHLGRVSESKFKRDFAGMVGGGYGGSLKKSDNDEDEIRAAERLNKWLNLSGVYVRRSKGDIREMPNISVGDNTTQIDQARFNAIYSSKVSGYKDPNLPISKLIAAREAVAQLKTGKTTAEVARIVREGQGKPPAASKVVVFSNFVEASRQLADKIDAELKKIDPKFHVITYLSDTKKADRASVKSRFTDDPNAKVLVMSMRMGGTGIDFPNAAQHMVINDFDWTPESAEQSEGRIYRINTNHPVHIQYVVGEGLDKDLFERVQKKREIAAIIQRYRRDYHDAEHDPESLKKIVDAQKEIKKIDKEMQAAVAAHVPGAEGALSESFRGFLSLVENFW